MSARRSTGWTRPGSVVVGDAVLGDGVKPKPGEVVLGSEAVLRVLAGGPGSKKIEARLAAPGTAVIEAVSLLAVMGELSQRGLSEDEVREVLDALALKIEDLDEDLAHGAAAVVKENAALGLCVADCCCVALARKLGLPVFIFGEGLGTLEGVEVLVG